MVPLELFFFLSSSLLLPFFLHGMTSATTAPNFWEKAGGICHATPPAPRLPSSPTSCHPGHSHLAFVYGVYNPQRTPLPLLPECTHRHDGMAAASSMYATWDTCMILLYRVFNRRVHDLAQIDCIDVECKTGKLLKKQGEVGQQVVPVQPTRLHATAGLLYAPAKCSKSNSERRRRLWGRAYQTWVWIWSSVCLQ